MMEGQILTGGLPVPEEVFFEPASYLDCFEAWCDTGQERVGLQEMTLGCSKTVMKSF